MRQTCACLALLSTKVAAGIHNAALIYGYSSLSIIPNYAGCI
jgi:hypothetical protein